jgi:hypothetical protein
MENYKDSQFGNVEVLLSHEVRIISEEGVEIGTSYEQICKLPNGHYVISQKKVFDEVPNHPMYSEYYVKKEWVELIVKNNL